MDSRGSEVQVRSAQNEGPVRADHVRARFKEIGGEISEFASTPELPEDLGEMFSADASVLIEALVETRSELRSAGRYDLADRIRQRLADLGFLLKDTPRGTEWKHRAP